MSNYPVDVAAVLDNAVSQLQALAESRPGSSAAHANWRDMDDVRHAVRALVKAAEAFPTDPNPFTYRAAHAALVSALNLCKAVGE